MLQRIKPIVAVAGLGLATASFAGTIVQDGSLSGGLGTSIHQIDLDQFDTMGGARTLDAVRLEALTAVSGGGQTDGNGGPPVSIFAQLSADYLLGSTILAETEATVDTVIEQNGPAIGYSVFDNDTADVQVLPLTGPGPWEGTGLVTVTARVQFEISEDPEGATGFGAGGIVQYTVTYEFTDNAPCPEDLDGDGNVGFSDLNQLLAVWGPCAGCPEDLDGDDNVGFSDLNTLLAAWGACR